MSHKTSLRVWEYSQTQRAARCLMLALADFANDDGICWPGTALLSKKINESPDYTDVIIKKCIELGELAKHAGRGRGHPSRFAILCGLTPDAQHKLKGVLQKGYPSTPINKRGTTKGVLIADKRGTFSDAKHRTNGASEPGETPINENEILHDPSVGVGVGDRAHLFVELRKRTIGRDKATAICATDASAADILTSIDNLFDPKKPETMGGVINLLIDAPPPEGHPYERPPRSDDAPDQRARHARNEKRTGRHNGTGGAERRDPGWMDREIAAAEARARSE